VFVLLAQQQLGGLPVLFLVQIPEAVGKNVRRLVVQPVLVMGILEVVAITGLL
jgi:hypothetical protein